MPEIVRTSLETKLNDLFPSDSTVFSIYCYYDRDQLGDSSIWVYSADDKIRKHLYVSATGDITPDWDTTQ